MAAAGKTPIQLYYSNTAGHAPTAANLISGELAINMADGLVFYKNSSNTVITVPTDTAARVNVVFTQANAAFAAANAGGGGGAGTDTWARDQANSAFIKANAAFIVANTGGGSGTGATITLPNGAIIKDNPGNSLAFGLGAGETTQGANAVAVGFSAGQITQGDFAVAVGSNAGNDTQGGEAVAIGVNAGHITQGTKSIAIGPDSGLSFQQNNSITIGTSSGSSYQGLNGQTESVGNSISIGTNTADPTIGFYATITNVIFADAYYMTVEVDDVYGFYNGVSCKADIGDTIVGYVESVEGNIISVNITINPNFVVLDVGISLFTLHGQSSSSLSIGTEAGRTNQLYDSIAIGTSAGQSNQQEYSIAIGYQAGQGHGIVVADIISANSGENFVVIANNQPLLMGTDQSSGGIIFLNSIVNCNNVNTSRVTSVDYKSQSPNVVVTIDQYFINDTTSGKIYFDSGQQTRSIAIGKYSGRNAQGGYSVALGFASAESGQGDSSVSIGDSAGYSNQASAAVALGLNAGMYNQDGSSIAIGNGAGTLNQGLASIAIGSSAAGNESFNRYYVSGDANPFITLDDTTGIMPGMFISSNYNDAIGGLRPVGEERSKYYVLSVIDSTTISVNPSIENFSANVYDYFTFSGRQGDLAIAIGSSAGYFMQGSEAIAIGHSTAGYRQGQHSVAVGPGAGYNTQGQSAVAVGFSAGQVTQGQFAVAIGGYAGYNTQGVYAVAVGFNAGQDTQGTSAIAIGDSAGGNTQGNQAVAIGVSAGQNTQGTEAVAIGDNAGNDTQGEFAVAVGPGAGYNTQGQSAVAIGDSAGQITQGQFAVAIGTAAGQNNQGNNSIIINATGNNLNQTTANTLTIAPIRNDLANTANVLYYNVVTNEVTVAPAPTSPAYAFTQANASYNQANTATTNASSASSYANSAFDKANSAFATANTHLPRVVTITDGTSITVNMDTTDLAIQTNTQAAGTLTINAPTGTPNNGQKFMIRVQCTNTQTLSFNGVFAGSTDIALPSSTTGSSKYDYMGFIYNSTATKWQMIGKNFGF